MTKRNRIIYWVSTVWLALGLTSTAAIQIFKLKTDGPGGVENVVHMGFPPDMLTLLGVWKILGVVALLVPGSPLLKEWAYAGFFFLITGALFSHIAVGHAWAELFPALLLLVLLVLSWRLRPSEQRTAVAGH